MTTRCFFCAFGTASNAIDLPKVVILRTAEAIEILIAS
jgi:hypothetical protein